MDSGDYPKVRRNLRYVRQVVDGRVSYVVKDPIRLQYFRFGEIESWLMQQMDGSRSHDEIARALHQQFGIATTGAGIEPFTAKLKQLGLAELTRKEHRLMLTESLRRDRRLKLKGHGSTLLRMRFSLGDPDRLFAWLEARLRFFWTPPFVVLSLLAMLGYAIILAAHWNTFASGLTSMSSAAFYTPGTILTLYLTGIAIIAVHEFGHGLTCKHFGGEVHELGGMLIYFMPAMYCNVNDAWTFEKRSHRLWVTFAGGWIQLVIAFLAALTWIGTEPETFVHRVAFLSLLIAGGMTVLINFNPLIPLDGYYALMDWLEIPNLRGRSFRFIGSWLKRNLLRLDVTIEPHIARERRVFIVYGLLAIGYSAALLLSITLLVSRGLISRFDVWGWVLAALAMFYLLRKPLRGMRRVLRVWWADQGSTARARRLLPYGAGVAAALVLIALLTPWAVIARGEVIVEPAARVWLRPSESGLVQQIRHTEGKRVRLGDTVAVLLNPDLELRWTHARAAVFELEHQVAAARARGRTDQARTADVQLTFRRSELAELERRRAGLMLRAPFDAIVVTPHLEELVWSGATRGDSLIEVWTTAPARVRIRILQRDAARIETGAAVELRFFALPGARVRTRISQVGVAAQKGVLELLAPLPANIALRPGMTGRAKVAVQRTSVAGAMLRSVRRTVRVDWWP